MLQQKQDAAMRVFLAITAPLSRARLRQSLLQDPSIVLVGDVTSSAALVSQLAEADPQFILCDEYVLADPDMERFARRRSQPTAPMFVLVVANPELFTYHGDISISTSLRLDVTGAECARQLLLLREPPPLPTPPPVAEMEDRFLVVGRKLDSGKLAPDPRPGNSRSTRELGAEDSPPSLHMTIPLDRWGRRQPSDTRAVLVERFSLVQSHLEQHRDLVTGLASPLALDSALRALQGSNCPAAVVVLQLWYVRSAGIVKRQSLDDAGLRQAGAVLRATLRHEDLACRLEGTCFAMMLAGIDEQTIPGPMGRLRAALRYRPPQGEDLTIAVAVGIGYWQPQMATSYPLEQAWQAMASESTMLFA